MKTKNVPYDDDEEEMKLIGRLSSEEKLFQVMVMEKRTESLASIDDY